MLAAFVSAPAMAQQFDQAKVLDIRGQGQYLKAGTAEWVELKNDIVLTEGDSVRTDKDSEVVLELTGSRKTAELVVREKSEFLFKTFNHEPGTELDNTLLDVTIGAVLVKAEKLLGDSKFEVKTPTSIVGIRGTTFEVQVSK
jgi:hypothetical protein